MAHILTISEFGSTSRPEIVSSHDNGDDARAELEKFAGTAYRINGTVSGTLSSSLCPGGVHQAAYSFYVREV
ncbi:hypothetical protein [Mycobacterium intracellulare]|uniref:hypothetical protein n=1 Tax=Mycobacterium intracellulare TaxID=1767 RepID=UPI001EED0378|nr:hypothetical protein [Mycobacterium intracellulare]MEE3755363.1 hypothetical protein [Mycobacterium intracellulare]